MSGRVLYVGVQGGEKNLDCFVFQQSDGQFACVHGDDQVHSLTVANGMVTPVNGVMTSTFGPRKHPILGDRSHPQGRRLGRPGRYADHGAPSTARSASRAMAAATAIWCKISHANGRETRYAHMQKFAIASGVGTKVKAGDVIGYIGTTGLSTGPHLHFELYQNGEAIDPLGTRHHGRHLIPALGIPAIPAMSPSKR